MSGRYNKAPLIYMMARVQSATFPKLTDDQKALLSQTMISLGYRQEVNSSAQELGFNFAFPQEERENSKIEVGESVYKRRAYFDDSKSNAFIFDRESIEFRTTAYTKFVEVSRNIQKVIDSVCEAIPACKDVLIREISLTYVDMIFPSEGRSLGEYFDSGESILPLSIFSVDVESDVHSFGSVQVTRIVEPNQRIVISLEQLPRSKTGYPTKILPSRLVERDEKFGMPITMNYTPTIEEKGLYALLTTESGTILSQELESLDFWKSSEDIHKQTSTMFKDLIDKEVCDQEWEYVTH